MSRARALHCVTKQKTILSFIAISTKYSNTMAKSMQPKCGPTDSLCWCNQVSNEYCIFRKSCSHFGFGLLHASLRSRSSPFSSSTSKKPCFSGASRVCHGYTAGRVFPHCTRGGYGYTPTRNYCGVAWNPQCMSYPRLYSLKYMFQFKIFISLVPTLHTNTYY
jgi:hypothetical protein